MKTTDKAGNLRPSEVKIILENALRSNYSREPWDAPNHHRWHAELQKIGMRLAGEKVAFPAEAKDLRKKRILKTYEYVWDRIRQAYAVLRGKAYTRPLRQSR